jgi:choline-sulfatase
VDRQLGRLLDALEATGLRENTLVIYTSDHGEMLGKFGMWWKCSLYEDSVRVPLIVAGPGFAAGKRVKTPVDLLDVQATLFQATGAERPAAWMGTPLQNIRPHDAHRVIFAEYHGHGTRASAFMVRRGRWKFIYYCAAPHQLFDLEADPHELHNLATERPDQVRELEAELRRFCDPEQENERAEMFIRRQLEAVRRQGDSESTGPGMLH